MKHLESKVTISHETNQVGILVIVSLFFSEAYFHHVCFVRVRYIAHVTKGFKFKLE